MNNFILASCMAIETTDNQSEKVQGQNMASSTPGSEYWF